MEKYEVYYRAVYETQERGNPGIAFDFKSKTEAIKTAKKIAAENRPNRGWVDVRVGEVVIVDGKVHRLVGIIYSARLNVGAARWKRISKKQCV